MSFTHKIISADTHIIEPPDLWTSRAPAKFKGRVPRFVRGEQNDEWWMGEEFIVTAARALIETAYRNKVYEGKQFNKLGIEDWDNLPTGRWEAVMPGAYQPKAFLRDQDIDGVYASVIYSSICLALWKRPSNENVLLREIFKEYNDWLAEFCSEDRSRLKGVALILLDDIEDSVRELQRCCEMGLAGVQIPTYPEPHRAYDDPMYEPFWEAAEALKMPMGLHIQAWRPQPIFGQMGPAAKLEPEVARFIGEGKPREGAQPGEGTFHFRPVDHLATTDFHVRRALENMIFSGVFERHPNLYAVTVEYDAGYVPYFLGRMDWTYKEFADFSFHLGGDRQARFKNDMVPSDFWRRNVRVTFQEDPPTIKLKDLIGPEVLMWGSDYPHREATWPMSRQRIGEFLEGLSEREVEMITGTNAAKLYNVQ